MDDGKVSEILALVSEFYHDIIVRILPGTFVVVVLLALYCCWLLWLPLLIPFGATLALIAAMSLVGAGYSVGLLLSPIGECMERLLYRDWAWGTAIERYKELIPDVFGQLGIDTRRLTPDQILEKAREQPRRIYLHLEVFLRDDPQAKALLPKIAAEAHMAKNLTAGLLLVCPAIAIHHGFFIRPVTAHHLKSLALESPAFLWALIALTVSFLASVYNCKRAYEWHFAYFALVKDRKR